MADTEENSQIPDIAPESQEHSVTVEHFNAEENVDVTSMGEEDPYYDPMLAKRSPTQERSPSKRRYTQSLSFIHSTDF
jgi:hypothetical protein